MCVLSLPREADRDGPHPNARFVAKNPSGPLNGPCPTDVERATVKETPMTTRQTCTFLGLGLAFLALGPASPAHAQYQAPPPAYAPPPGYGYPPPPPAPPPRFYRSGLTLGAGLGFGGISASDCG